MEKIMQFLDPNLPCPDEVPDCINLRNTYLQEVKVMQQAGGCSNCQLRKVREKYITMLQNIIK